MKKVLKKGKGEILNDWYKRLAKSLAGKDVTEEELFEIFREVGITSYWSGSKAAFKSLQ